MIQQIHPADVKALLDAGSPVLLVDVRQPEEHAFCALPGSLLVPLGELRARAGEIEPPGDALVVVYCHHGVRSMSGAALLKQAGVDNVASMAGGIDLWSLSVDPAVPRY
ncbi:rhodanese-like domain-containing protein [Gemmata sp.]|uniref:rhodanese-like domain-containing protein n=1 Tax=Gemmata sp. TaxID=1914242 RepID=UPI003F714CC1